MWSLTYSNLLELQQENDIVHYYKINIALFPFQRVMGLFLSQEMGVPLKKISSSPNLQIS